jgi:LacI family transcriptional regulator
MIDVARAANVSLKTVSRVVNGEPGVRAATAARVRETIAALGFRRNDMARALRRGQLSRTLGLVIEDVSNPFYSAIIRGVEEVARRQDMLVIAGSSDEDPERERELLLSLCERRVDGLVIVPAGDDHRYLLPEIQLGTHMVFVDRPPGNIDGDVILLDSFGGTYAAVEHLLAHGHRRIGIIADAPAIFTASERLRGYREALAAHAIPVEESLIATGVSNSDAAKSAATALLAPPARATALLTGNNRITIGALRTLMSRGRQIALVGFDDFELAEMLPVPVTVIAYDPVALGRAAAKLVCRRLAGDRSPSQRIVFPTRLVARGSGEIRP